MKIILLKDVKDLGKSGDLVDAKPGFARNFLIPKGEAVEATPANKRRWEKEQKELAKSKEEQEQEAAELKESLEELTVVVKGKAGEGGRLFGSVTSQDISDALKKQHKIDVDKRKIELDDNIKSLGVTKVDVRVYPKVVAKLKVDVKE